jgi:hypothetical protein
MQFDKRIPGLLKVFVETKFSSKPSKVSARVSGMHRGGAAANLGTGAEIQGAVETTRVAEWPS